LCGLAGLVDDHPALPPQAMAARAALGTWVDVPLADCSRDEVVVRPASLAMASPEVARSSEPRGAGRMSTVDIARPRQE
jgi:hypothetical protein